MFDTHAIARKLAAADFTPAQADALTDAIREAAAHGDHATRADLLALELRLIKWAIGIAVTVGVAGTAAIIGALRLLLPS